MNKWVIGILSFAAGAGIGAVSASYILKKHYAELADQEIEEARAWVREMRERYEKDEKDQDTQTNPAEEDAPRPTKLDVRPRPKKVDYTAFYPSRRGKPDLEGLTVNRDPAEEEYPTEEDSFERKKPYMIDEKEFLRSEKTCELLTWYVGDATLTDDQDEIIHNVADILGEEAAKLLDGVKLGDSLDVIYVENESIDLIFEVCIDERSYSEDILGGFYPDEVPEANELDERARRIQMKGRRRRNDEEE